MLALAAEIQRYTDEATQAWLWEFNNVDALFDQSCAEKLALYFTVFNNVAALFDPNFSDGSQPWLLGYENMDGLFTASSTSETFRACLLDFANVDGVIDITVRDIHNYGRLVPPPLSPYELAREQLEDLKPPQFPAPVSR